MNVQIQRRKHSVVWNFFTEDTKQYSAVCDICKQVLSYKSSVSNLKKHLQKKHPTIKFQETVKITNEYTNPQTIESSIQASSTNSEPSTSASIQELHLQNPSTSARLTKKIFPIRQDNQNKITNYIPKKLCESRKKKIDDELVKLFYLDYQPFSVVDDKGFRLFVNALNPNYELPTRQAISKTMIPFLYEKYSNSLRKYLDNLDPYVCLTTDCWTSINNDSFMATTVHFLNENYEMESALLNCAMFEKSCSSENLSKELLAVTRRWGLENKITLAVSDNAANIKAAIASTGWKFFGCFAHSLNLIVMDALKLPGVKTTVEKVKTIVSHFKRSSKATLKLNRIQKNSGINIPKKLLQDVITRWNSTFFMIQRFVELEVPLRSTVALLDVTLPTLTAEEWDILRELCKILLPFERATSIISGENYMSASLVIVVTNGLLDACFDLLNIPDLSDSSKSVINKLQSGIKERLGTVEYSNTLALCTYLDPRFKAICFKNADTVERVRKYVTNAITELLENTDEGQNNEPEEPASKKQKMDEEDCQFSIWSALDKAVSGKEKKQNTSTSRARAIMEVQRYIEHAILNRKKDPMVWWRECGYMYPNLSKLVRKKCCALATSVPCERLFSKAGNLLNERRTRLSAKKVEQMLFLNVNSKFM